MKNTDAALIHRILNGDENAFTELVKKYQKQIHALVWRKIGDFHIAEEITQDTFLKAYKKLATLKKPQRFASWLYVIAANRCSSWLRKKRLRTQPLEDLGSAQLEKATYSGYVVEENERAAVAAQRDVVKKLLSKLQESERTVITLHYFGEMTCAEISEFLGVSVGAIKSRLSRARHRLKKEEPMIREVLENFQIAPYLTENIMQKVSRVKPDAPTSGNQPFVPWAIIISTAAIAFLMLGIGNQQHLTRVQMPYSFDATAEMTIELIDAPIMLNLAPKPNVRTQLGSPNASRNSKSILKSAKPENSRQKENTTMQITSAQDLSHITIDVLNKRGVYSVAFSPDGSTLASDKDNTIRLWDAATGQEVKMEKSFLVDIVGKFTADINSVAFSPDGRKIAGGIHQSETICLWNAATGEQLRAMRADNANALHWVNTVAFSVDNKILASGSEDGNLYLWDAETGMKIRALMEGPENIFSVAFSSDGKTLASGNSGNTIQLWDITTGEKLKTLTGHTNWVFSVAFSPDGQTLASGSGDKTVHLWDMITGQQRRVLTGHTSEVWSVAFSPDGLTLASGSGDKTIRLWNTETGEERATLIGHTGPIKSVAFSPDGIMLASGSKDSTVRLWDLTSPMLLRKDQEK